jgi:hypothetical protein
MGALLLVSICSVEMSCNYFRIRGFHIVLLSLGKGSFGFVAQGYVRYKVAGFMAVYMSAVKFTTLKVPW